MWAEAYEFVEAFMKQNGGQEAVEKEAADAFEKALGEAARGAAAKQPSLQKKIKEKAPEESPDWKNKKAVKETVTKLIGEFGSAAAEFYRKALRHNKPGQTFDRAGLRSHPDIGRTLVLLGREMFEERTPAAKTGGTGSSHHTFDEGACLYLELIRE
jgi:hypothetical protein